MQKKKVLIDIDFVLRDWVQALQNNYIAKIGDLEGEIENLDTIWNYFKFPQYIELEKDTDDPDIKEHTLAVDEKADWTPNREYFNKFVLDNVLEIYGYANECVPNAVLHVNKLQIENPDFEIILFSKSKGKAIPPTYFFLSKTGCEIKHIMFIQDYKELHSYPHTVVSANPDCADYFTIYFKGSSEPITKFYLVTSQFNQNYTDYNRIDSIKEILTFTSSEN